MTKRIFELIDSSHSKFLIFQIRCIMLGVLYTIAALVFPNAISQVIDKVILNKNYEDTMMYLTVITLSGVFMMILSYFQYMSYYKFGQRAYLNIRKKIFNKLMISDGSFREKYTSGNILRMMEQDTLQIENLVGQTVGQLMENIIVVLGVITLLFLHQILIGVIMICISFAFSLFQLKLSDTLKKQTIQLRKALGDLSSSTSEVINHLEHVITTGYKNHYKNENDKKSEDIISQNIVQMRKILISRNIGIAYNVLSNVITLGIGVHEVIKGRMTVGILLAISMYVQRLYGPLITIADSYLNIEKSIPYIKNITSFFDNNDEITEGDIEPQKCMKGRIVFDNVSFAYDQTEIFKDVSFIINPNEITAIVGVNGSGKSTFVKLLLKTYRCKSGMIYIDNISINDYVNSYYYNNISTMFQNNKLLSGNLMRIINPGNKELSQDYIYTLFKNVRLDISKFENGLDTNIYENNINLSGGELQKINIVRILIEDRPLIILDEPTSALDGNSEIEICELLKDLLKGKTVIVITHRNKILEICNRIIKFPC